MASKRDLSHSRSPIGPSPAPFSVAPLTAQELLYVRWHHGFHRAMIGFLLSVALGLLIVPVLLVTAWPGVFDGLGPEQFLWWSIGPFGSVMLGVWLYAFLFPVKATESVTYHGTFDVSDKRKALSEFRLVSADKPDVLLSVPSKWQVYHPNIHGDSVEALVVHMFPRHEIISTLYRYGMGGSWGVLLEIKGVFSVRDTLKKYGIRFYVEHAILDVLMAITGLAVIGGAVAVLMPRMELKTMGDSFLVIVISIIAMIPFVILALWINALFSKWRFGQDYLEAQRPAE